MDFADGFSHGQQDPEGVGGDVVGEVGDDDGAREEERWWRWGVVVIVLVM